MNRRISEQERVELITAIQNGEVQNATAFADAFARTHGLNSNTVRSAISRYRREAGMLQQHPRRRRDPGEVVSVPVLGGYTTFGRMLTADPPDLAEIAAVAIVRYEAEPDFKEAVDRFRPEAERFYRKLGELREMKQGVEAELGSDVFRYIK
jgi:hypothetical protein